MKIRLILAMTVAFLMGVGLSSAQAVSLSNLFAGASNIDAFMLAFDEFGNGSIQNPTGSTSTPVHGTLQNDPTVPAGGTPRMVLIFPLPMPVVTGDVRIFEPALPTPTLTDLLRFTNATGDLSGQLNGDRMIFYSDIAEREAILALADTGFPSALVPRDGGGIVEVGPQDNNFFVWIPNGPNDNIYRGTSDGVVAEPATLLLLGSGLAGLAGVAWRRRRG